MRKALSAARAAVPPCPRVAHRRERAPPRVIGGGNATVTHPWAMTRTTAAAAPRWIVTAGHHGGASAGRGGSTSRSLRRRVGRITKPGTDPTLTRLPTPVHNAAAASARTPRHRTAPRPMPHEPGFPRLPYGDSRLVGGDSSDPRVRGDRRLGPGDRGGERAGTLRTGIARHTTWIKQQIER
ncbi:hypothetical protein GCM10022243_53900 [Saccharothrix violaceirubra]